MPHGRLTRLGHSLREVLITFSRQTIPFRASPSQYGRGYAPRRRFANVSRPSLLAQPCQEFPAGASSLSANAKDDKRGHRSKEQIELKVRRSSNRRPRSFPLAKSNPAIVPDLTTRQSHSCSERDGVSHTDEWDKHRRRFSWTIQQDGLVPFNLILSHCQQKLGCALAEGFMSHNDFEQKLVADHGCRIDEVRSWIEILDQRDSSAAYEQLRTVVRSAPSDEIVLGLLSEILVDQKVPLSLVGLVVQDLGSRTQSAQNPVSASLNTVWSVFDHLTRIARDLSPGSLPQIAATSFAYLPQAFELPQSQSDYARLQSLTLMTNAALITIAQPTALQPFKDSVHQERAIVHVLEYMASHVPAIPLNRQGYRAVISIQLRLGKTASEKRWAELKAQSWPPWKVDRTQMDAGITPESGLSRAAGTLRQMQEAGYGLRGWERVAQLYTGWDTDNTPTIQTRVLLPVSRHQVTRHALWAARITTTRTLQEAWAAWLSYEDDVRGRFDPIVILAIVKKLHLEEARSASQPTQQSLSTEDLTTSRTDRPRDRILSGDARELEPLPASIHLHTYTRVSAPTLAVFYGQLRTAHIDPGAATMLFLIAHARNPRQGLCYIQDASAICTGLEKILLPSFKPSILRSISRSFVNAYILLLCRFPKSNLDRILDSKETHDPYLMGGFEINTRVALGNAIRLVKELAMLDSRSINAIMEALAKQTNVVVAKSLLKSHGTFTAGAESDAVAVYRLAVAFLCDEKDLEGVTDLQTLMSFARITENALIGQWEHSARYGNVTTARARLEPFDVVQRVMNLFDDITARHNVHERPDILLAVPGPALWHNLIRIVGLSADYKTLTRVLRIMCANVDRLKETIEHERNGHVLMQRLFVAVRVYLERSWLVDVPALNVDDVTTNLFLEQMRAPAPRNIIEQVRSMLEETFEEMEWPSDEQAREYWSRNPQLVRIRDLYLPSSSA